MTTSTRARTLLQRRFVQPHSQGTTKISQTIGSGEMSEFMPFLLLDDLSAARGSAGFGPHPHRGQETLTYLFEGEVYHGDSNGGTGILKGGDLQLMRAGKGIVHDERPHWSPGGPDVMRGIQIWVALPHANLNDKPWYQDLTGANLPISHPSPGVTVKIVFGESYGVSSPVLNRAPVWYLDIKLEPHTTLSHPMPADFNVFAHIVEGEPTIAGSTGTPHETFFFKRDGDAVEVRNDTDQATRLLLVGGDPLTGQEVHRYGPFVSTSAADLERTFMNYRRGTNGFEGAHDWIESRP